MSKVKRIKCPDCLNYMTVTVNDNGEAKEIGRAHV